MKKMILMMMAMMTMTLAHAENEETETTNVVEAYDMSVNFDKLAKALELNADQRDAVEEIHSQFAKEMLFIAQSNKDARESMVEYAVKKDLRFMRYVLDRDQYRKYLLLLNVTLHNRGLR